MKKIITVTTGTRADYGLLRPILFKIKNSNKLNLKLIVTGTHFSSQYGKTIDDVINDGFTDFIRIDNLPKGDLGFHMSVSLGHGVIKFSEVFQRIKPAFNLVLGDRDEMLASALAAYHMNIPNVHVHGGDISGGIDEYTRHAITKISNLHFAASKSSKERIIKMGENPKHVFFSGSPGIDEIKLGKIAAKKDLEKKLKLKIKGDEIILVYHPVTTESEKSKQQITSIVKVLKRLKKQVIAISPNSDAGNKKIFEILKLYSQNSDFLHSYPSLPRKYYLGLLKYADVLVGNSSSGIIEGSYFDIPVVNLGTRQINREGGNNIYQLNSYSSTLLFKTINTLLKKKKTKIRHKFIYGKGNSASIIVSHLEKINPSKELIQKQIQF